MPVRVSVKSALDCGDRCKTNLFLSVGVNQWELLVYEETPIVREEEEEGRDKNCDPPTSKERLQAPQHAKNTLNREEGDGKDERRVIVGEHERHCTHHEDERDEEVDHCVVQQPGAEVSE